MEFVLIPALAALGVLAGFLAGLLGIGGGIVLVPGLYYIFTTLGFDPAFMMHMAVGTSLAVIVPTGLSSARAHWRREAVDLSLVLRLGAGVVIGVALGTLAADQLSGVLLKAVFAFAIMGLAGVMVSNPARYTIWDAVPGQPWAGLAGIFIGGLSTLLGIGGATISVPYMSMHKVPIRRAVGTAAALGLVVAVPGMLGFMLIGLDAGGLPPFSLGYINGLAWAVIVPFSVLAAPLGAKVAHALPVEYLRRVFAVFMILVAARMLMDVFGGNGG